MNFINELKRRNVIRMAGLYLVGGWLITQVAATLLDVFGAPDWVMKVLVALLIIGFIGAMVFSWVYELTPEGLKRDSEVRPEDSIAAQTAARLDKLILVGLVVVVVLVAADRFWPRDARQDLASSSTSADVQGDTETTAGAGAKTAGRATGDGKLIAVLPFRNRSVKEEDAFFAEGIHDDLLTQLSRVPVFKVISRTSMMRYRDSNKSIPDIARELGAGVVLEGAVQRSGKQVRITVQLIDGASDVHLWAESYDRELSTENLFAIQADIAKAIADAMALVLTPEQQDSLITRSTKNLEAYDYFLRGKLATVGAELTPETMQTAITAFDRAIDLDPAFADAWAMKARAQLTMYWHGLGSSPRSQRDNARQSLAQAQRLAPDAIETLIAEAYLHYWGQRDYPRAEAVLQKVLERTPGNADAWLLRAYVARRDGRFKESTAIMQQALQIDPVKGMALLTLLENQHVLGDFTQAERTLEHKRSLGIARPLEEFYFRQSMGDAQGAWASIKGAVSESAPAPFKAALLTRDAGNIARSLSPSLWPLDQRTPTDFPEVYAMAQAEGMLVLGQSAKAKQVLDQIQTRMSARDQPYPSGWMPNALYFPCDLPGLRADLQGVRAAERDYLDNAPRDEWAKRDIHESLAAAFARAGDKDRALYYLESISAKFGPASYLRYSINPGLDAVRNEPRYLTLQAAYQRWAAERKP